MTDSETTGNERHRVTVEFTHNLSEYESAEDFVESCLNGNRASSFAWAIEVVESETVEDEGGL